MLTEGKCPTSSAFSQNESVKCYFDKMVFVPILTCDLCRDPNKWTDEYLRDIRWRQMVSDRFNYLDIGEELVMKDGLNLERYDIWKALFPLPPRRRGKDVCVVGCEEEIAIDDYDDIDDGVGPIE